MNPTIALPAMAARAAGQSRALLPVTGRTTPEPHAVRRVC
jgi:hypothetical protein